MSKSHNINQPSVRRLRSKLFDLQLGKCYWCRRRMMTPDQWGETGPSTPDSYPTLDHLLARSLGGTNEQSNLVLACYACNHKRGQAVGA